MSTNPGGPALEAAAAAPEPGLVPRPPEAPPPDDFQPEITAFTCNYCGYMAADTAGALRASYPANIKLVRLPCTGKTDLQYLLDAFEQGADGVYVVACGLGNCHHERGNERGQARVQRTKALLEAIGLEPEWLDMFFVSGGMGATFAEIAAAWRAVSGHWVPARCGTGAAQADRVSASVGAGTRRDAPSRALPMTADPRTEIRRS